MASDQKKPPGDERTMKPSLCSQSLFSLSLDEAIEATSRIGFPAIELACCPPHFDSHTAATNAQAVAEAIHQAGLQVSALSLFTDLANRSGLRENIRTAEMYVSLAPLFGTDTVKITPGPPSSKDAETRHWSCLQEGVEALAPLAEQVGVRLAFETHMRQLTDTLASSERFLAMTSSDYVGLTVDFCNLAFAGEEMSEVLALLGDRTFNTHVKNGYVGTEGRWHFQALDQGLVDYPHVIGLLRSRGYTGYLAVECLGEEAKADPAGTARRDLHLLTEYIAASAGELP